MVEKLYLKDAYLKEFDAAVTKVDGNKIYLNKTVFYPTGGGQPNDTGKLSINGSDFAVLDVKKDEEDIAHTVENASAVKEGDSVHGVIDWEKRYAYMRHHTTIHLIDGVVNAHYSDKGLVTGGQIYADRARMDFDMPTFNRELAQKIVDDTNKEVEAHRRIIVKDLTQEQALAIPNLARTEPGRELIKRLDVVRVVEIEGLDAQADGGLHVLNSKEVGKVVFNGFKNQGSHSKRLEIRLE